MTKRVRRPAVVGILALAAALGPVTPSAYAADTTPPQLVDVQVVPSSVDVSGFAFAAVTIRLHLTDDSGVQQINSFNGSIGDNYPSVAFTRTTTGLGQISSAFWGDNPPFRLATGTPQDGWWERTQPVTAGYQGTFTVTHVYAYDTSFNLLSVDPRTQGIDATLDVTATHVPHLSIKQSPDYVVPGAPLTLYGHVTYADTAAPVKDVTVHAGFDTSCVEGSLGSAAPATDADGAWRLAFGTHYGGLSCATIYNDLTHTAGLDDHRALYVNIPVGIRYDVSTSAQVTRTPITLGQSTSIVGTTRAGTLRKAAPIALQQLIGRTWRTVATTYVRSSGRYTVEFAPTSRGNLRYRVVPILFAPDNAKPSPVVLVGVG